MAEEVCADDQIPAHRVLDLLAALIDKSLVALEDEVAGDARYRLLDTIKAYAAEQLPTAGEQEQFRPVMPVTCSGRGRGKQGLRTASRRPGRNESCLYRQIDTEQSNFRAALAFSLAVPKPSVACGCARRCGRPGWCTVMSPRASGGSTDSSG